MNARISISCHVWGNTAQNYIIYFIVNEKELSSPVELTIKFFPHQLQRRYFYIYQTVLILLNKMSTFSLLKQVIHVKLLCHSNCDSVVANGKSLSKASFIWWTSYSIFPGFLSFQWDLSMLPTKYMLFLGAQWFESIMTSAIMPHIMH